jgi:hypothetical protein
VKANRSILRDERAVSEVVGYMIALSLSTVILVMSLTAFNAMREHSSDILTDRAVREIAARVATTVEEGLEAGARFPESDFERTLVLPREVQGQSYVVHMNKTHVRVIAMNAGPPLYDAVTGEELETTGRAHLPIIPRAGVLVLCDEAPPEIAGGTCSVDSGSGRVTVRFGETTVDGAVARGVYLLRE